MPGSTRRSGPRRALITGGLLLTSDASPALSGPITGFSACLCACISESPGAIECSASPRGSVAPLSSDVLISVPLMLGRPAPDDPGPQLQRYHENEAEGKDR